jgi:hypothetical protein
LLEIGRFRGFLGKISIQEEAEMSEFDTIIHAGEQHAESGAPGLI